MEGLLGGWGCDVRSARSLKDIDKDALLLGWLPDLVLMDYHLDQTSASMPSSGSATMSAATSPRPWSPPTAPPPSGRWPKSAASPW